MNQAFRFRDILRKHGIAEGTCYRWKSKFGGMEPGDVKRLRNLEQANNRLETMVADLMLENQVLKDVNSKEW